MLEIDSWPVNFLIAYVLISVLVFSIFRNDTMKLLMKVALASFLNFG